VRQSRVQFNVSGQYYLGLGKSTAAGAALTAATPYAASALPSYVTTTIALGGAGYGVYSSGDQAVNHFRQGNYASGTFNVGMAGMSAYGGYQVARPLVGIPEVRARNPMSEYCRFREQGYWPRQARDLMRPYDQPGRGNDGNHFIGRRWFESGLGRHLPERLRNSMQDSHTMSCDRRGLAAVAFTSDMRKAIHLREVFHFHKAPVVVDGPGRTSCRTDFGPSMN
jgi:hypothetical protein